jgi:hypothetical protein
MMFSSPPQGPPVRYLYSDIYKMVNDGETVLLSVGKDHPNAVRCDDAKKFGVQDGVYRCFLENSIPKMEKFIDEDKAVINRPVVNYIRNVTNAIIGQP